MMFMRTTLTIDDEVANQLTELAHRSREPFKTIVNQTLRRGLEGIRPDEGPFLVQAHDGGMRPGIDDRRLNELVFELEEEQFRVKAAGAGD